MSLILNRLIKRESILSKSNNIGKIITENNKGKIRLIHQMMIFMIQKLCVFTSFCNF